MSWMIISANTPQVMPGLLFMGFNQDAGCFVYGTQQGFNIFSSKSLRQICKRDFDTTGIVFVEILFNSNILAYIGNENTNKVMIWDDRQSFCIGEQIYRQEVKAVHLRKDRTIIVLYNKVLVYNFTNQKLLDTIDTGDNPKGLCCISSDNKNMILITIGKVNGTIIIHNYNEKIVLTVIAHHSELCSIALSRDGTLVATASVKGTIIRVFNTQNGQIVREFRRGSKHSEIYSLAFHSSKDWLAVSCDSGTTHIFHLSSKQSTKNISISDSNTSILSNYLHIPSSSSSSLKINDIESINNQNISITQHRQGNTTSTLSALAYLVPYYGSEWSFAQYKLLEPVQNIIAFSNNGYEILGLCVNGYIYKIVFYPDKPGKECKLEFYKRVVDG